MSIFDATPSDAMMNEARQWLEVSLGLPDGLHQFDDALLATEQADNPTFEALIMMASAALMIANNGSVLSPLWYRERAQMLLYRAYNVIAAERANQGAIAEVVRQRPALLN